MNTRIALFATALLFSPSAFSSPFFNIWDASSQPQPFGRIAYDYSQIDSPASGGLIITTFKARLVFSDYTKPTKPDVSVTFSDVTKPYDSSEGYVGFELYHAGIANTGVSALPYVIIASSRYGSSFSVRAITMDGVIKWTKNYYEVGSAGFRIYQGDHSNLSRVGNFLNVGDGKDELEVVRYKYNADDSRTFEYKYYNVLTGGLISSKTVTVAKP